MSRRGLWGVVVAAAAVVGAAVLVKALRGGRPEPVGQSNAYHGNPDSMVFHRDGCRLYSPGIDGPAFDSAQAAVDSGYRPCGICNP